MPLTDITVRTAKPKDKQYKLSDTAGLHLLIKPTGSKYWRYKYRVAGKEKLLSIGVYPIVSLAEAREKCLLARKQLSNGIDPSQDKKDKKLKHNQDTQHSLEAIAREWHKNQQLSWTDRHSDYVMRRLETNLFPELGSKPINQITPSALLSVLRVIENRGAIDIAHRVLQSCGQVFRYAISTERAERDITTDLRGALKTRKKENNAYLQAKELPEFLQKLETYDGELQTKLALKLLLLTFVRAKELRGAKWSEIDFENKDWRIPAERMKMRDPHIVPLSDQAINILKQLHALNSHREHVLPNRNQPLTFISENTMLYAIYRMGYHSRTTAHGFRSTASTILNENNFGSDIIERQLAHTERNSVRASYNHAQYLDKRREMMQWWADYLDKTRKIN
jgi:integrase